MGRHEAQAAVTWHRGFGLGDDKRARLRQPGQDLQRPCKVKLRQLRENHESDIEERHCCPPFDLKRARNCLGDAPTARAKARSMRRKEPKPHLRATRSILSPVSSNRRRAKSTRTRSTKSAGLTLRLP